MSSSSDEEEDERAVTHAPRAWAEPEVKKRVRKLPIKREGGSVIPQDVLLPKPILATKAQKTMPMVEENAEDGSGDDLSASADEDDDDGEDWEPEANSTKQTSDDDEDEEEKASAPISTEEHLQTIAALATSILANETNAIQTEGVRTNAKGEAVAPEKTALERLMHYARAPNTVWTVRKAAWLSLLSVFKDILPDEYVRELTEKELQAKATKETRMQRAQEKLIMTAYKQYVSMLLEEKGNAIATYCLCHLLEARGTGFNLADGILTHVLTRANKVCLDSLGRVLDDDLTFEATLVILKRVGRIYEKKSSRGVSAPLLELFSRLKLSLDLKDEKRMKEIEKAKKHRKDKKRRLGADLTKLLEETDATSTRNHEIHQRQMEIIRELFTLYLRILTTRSPGNAKRAPLTIQALRGARKLVQLVNVEFIHGIVRLLSTFDFSQEFNLVVALETCETGLTSLAVLARPELRTSKVECEEDFYSQLLLRCIPCLGGVDDFKLAHQCVQLLFFRRREGDSRVVTDFCKALVGLALRTLDGALALGAIALQRALVERYPGVKDIFLGSRSKEEEACGPLIPVGGGGGLENGIVSKKAWELDLLGLSHFDIAVRRAAQDGRALKPLLNAKPVDMAMEHDAVHGVLFHPLPPPRSSSAQQKKPQHLQDRKRVQPQQQRRAKRGKQQR